MGGLVRTQPSSVIIELPENAPIFVASGSRRIPDRRSPRPPPVLRVDRKFLTSTNEGGDSWRWLLTQLDDRKGPGRYAGGKAYQCRSSSAGETRATRRAPTDRGQASDGTAFPSGVKSSAPNVAAPAAPPPSTAPINWPQAIDCRRDDPLGVPAAISRLCWKLKNDGIRSHRLDDRRCQRHSAANRRHLGRAFRSSLDREPTLERAAEDRSAGGVDHGHACDCRLIEVGQ